MPLLDAIFWKVLGKLIAAGVKTWAGKDSIHGEVLSGTAEALLAKLQAPANRDALDTIVCKVSLEMRAVFGKDNDEAEAGQLAVIDTLQAAGLDAALAVDADLDPKALVTKLIEHSRPYTRDLGERSTIGVKRVLGKVAFEVCEQAPKLERFEASAWQGLYERLRTMSLDLALIKEQIKAGTGALGVNRMEERAKTAVVVIHASQDRADADRFVQSLRQQCAPVSIVTRELAPGATLDSVLSSDAALNVVTLSPAAVQLPGMKADISAESIETHARQGIEIMPVLLDSTGVPEDVRRLARIDLSKGVEAGVKNLVGVFSQETVSARIEEPANEAQFSTSTCTQCLSALSLGELRRLMTRRLGRDEVRAVWFDVLETNMENDLVGRTLVDCVIELLERAKNRNRLADVVQSLCETRSDLANP